MHYQPTRRLRPAAVIICILLAAATLFWITDLGGIGWRGINQLGCAACLTAAVYLLLRYLLTSYVYCLSEDGQSFSVVRIRSKRPTTVADIRLSPADRLIPYTRSAARPAGAGMVENYRVSLFAAEEYLLITQIDGKPVALRLECEADTARLISRAIENAPRSPEDL